MPDPVLTSTLDVSVRGELYVFRIPSFKDEIKLGLLEREIRRSMEAELYGPSGAATGMPTGDTGTEFMVRVAAQFQHLLVKGPAWVWSNGPDGKPVADYSKWPDEKVDTAIEVGVAFSNELRRFRAGGDTAGNPAGEQAVAGQPAPASEPVRPDAPQP